jgi:proline dehydrogenase
MPNQLLLAAARSARARAAVTRVPVTRRVVERFVAGERVDDALAATTRLLAAGLRVTIDHLGEDTRSREQVSAATAAYRTLLASLAAAGLTAGAAGLTAGAEVSVKLSALGQALPGDGHRLALEAARNICAAAQQAGTTVTVDMEDHTTVDSTLSIVRELRDDFPWVGVAVQSCLYRTEADCVDLATAGSRVRLVKGAYAEPASVAHRSKADVDRAYARCLGTLMTGGGHPMVATHDPALITLAQRLAAARGRSPGSYEYQMLYGIRPDEQLRLAEGGAEVRIYLPYGDEWYGYFMRRLAERPANVVFFLRSFTPRRPARSRPSRSRPTRSQPARSQPTDHS